MGKTSSSISTAPQINHVGLTVTDIDDATSWYHDILGFDILVEPIRIESDDSDPARRFRDIVGEFEYVLLSQLQMGDGTGLELFEYPASETPDSRGRGQNHWQAQPGIHHLALTHPDLDFLVNRVCEAGGTQHSKIWEVNDDSRFVYLRDPWGNFIEVYNRPHADFYE